MWFVYERVHQDSIHFFCSYVANIWNLNLDTRKVHDVETRDTGWTRLIRDLKSGIFAQINILVIYNSSKF